MRNRSDAPCEPSAFAFAEGFVVQVAGCRSADEARALAGTGIDWLGIPLRLDVHPPDVDDDVARAIADALPKAVRPVLITYLSKAVEIHSLMRKLRVHTVQVHGDISTGELKSLRCLVPLCRIIKSIVVGAPEHARPLEVAQRYSPFVDAFITDTYDPATDARGATGLCHDWAVSRRLAANAAKPVILAGGLTPENVEEAVQAVRPAGVDCHTGVERPDGSKDPEAVRAFCQAAREAHARLQNDHSRSVTKVPR